jgi:hypothetical protein
LWTLKSQRDQIGEQRAFIAQQSQFMAEQSANLTLERAELRAAAENRKWAQAQQVRMHDRTAGGGTDGQGVTTDDDHWDVTVTNHSDAPVHQVEVRFGTAYTAAEVYEWRPHWNPGGAAERGDRLTSPVHLIGPNRGVRFRSQRWPSVTVHNNRATLYFTDNNGVRWMLDWHGQLAEAPPEAGE